MKISVIIPCYNCENTIKITLDSILEQASSDVEIVCVNDGSKDKTANILSEYSDRIKCIHQENSGVSIARNNGVKHASGEWVAFCDADDIWHKDKLRILLQAINSVSDVDFIFHDFYILLNGEILEKCATHSKNTFFPIFSQWNITIPDILTGHKQIDISNIESEWDSMNLHFGNAFYWLIMGNFVLPSSVAIRRTAFLGQNGFTDEFIYAEDTEFFLRISKQVNFMYIDLPLVGYRRTTTSLLSTSMLQTMENGIRSIYKNCVEDEAIYKQYKDRIDSSLAKKYARLAYFHLSESRNREALKLASKALKLNIREKLAWITLFFSFTPIKILNLIRGIRNKFK